MVVENKPKLTMNCLFSGIGCQEEGFINSGCFDVEVIATSDIEPNSIYQYAIIHCGLTKEMLDTYEYPSQLEMADLLTFRNIGLDVKTGKCKDWYKMRTGKGLNDLKKYYLATILQNNLGDISKVEELPYADFWFTSSPCQSISVAGKQEGLAKDSGTRSSLIWETEPLLKRAIEKGEQPKYICLENVKNIVSKKFKPDFDAWVSSVEALGYTAHWTVMNAKECGVPQNRERVFCLFIRNDLENGKFEFPVPFDNGKRLKDVLAKKVDDKYYLSEKMVENMTLNLEKAGKNFIDIIGHSGTGGQKGYIHTKDGGVGSLSATDYKQPKQFLEYENE